jgi:hypothetical protein
VKEENPLSKSTKTEESSLNNKNSRKKDLIVPPNPKDES